ncbi:tryptophan synthase beta subunit-like PLP-dependent enzyme [Ampelomyces quisqualis]|uniref:L-serine ammonia-lyase n=1 Tax=Ampelomyces quisqualis TaxID=50730 RepID=A0A6A5QXI6_AMPQU|nr:tryptophan synthase beta subunit-like PLP-dependent enzyme [Ampelomyces quisqualis]
MTITNDEEIMIARPWRRTPLLHSTVLSKHAGCQIYLKLENLQPSGSFKSRGIGNFLLAHISKAASKSNIHFFTSSGGNAGLACVTAAVSLNVHATIVVPMSTSKYMIGKLHAAGAQDVVQYGDSWAEADSHLREVVIPRAKSRNEETVYVHPFDDEAVWDGHATLVPEILEDLHGEAPDVAVCSVGGGGLFTGIIQGLDTASVQTKVLAVETEATRLGARRVAAKAFEYAKREFVTSVVLKDRDAIEGCVGFADDERIMVEPACGVSIAMCYSGRLKKLLPGLTERSRVVIVVCGGSNVTAAMLHGWVEDRQ